MAEETVFIYHFSTFPQRAFAQVIHKGPVLQDMLQALFLFLLVAVCLFLVILLDDGRFADDLVRAFDVLDLLKQL